MNATTPFSVRSSRSSRSGTTGSPLGRGLDLGCLDELACSHLGERLEVGLHRGDLGDGVDDRPLDLFGNLVGLVERQVAGQLQMEGELDVASERDDAEVVDLADPRDGHRGCERAVSQRDLVGSRLDVDDDVAAG